MKIELIKDIKDYDSNNNIPHYYLKGLQGKILQEHPYYSNMYQLKFGKWKIWTFDDCFKILKEHNHPHTKIFK
jgi:hypothetical protein